MKTPIDSHIYSELRRISKLVNPKEQLEELMKEVVSKKERTLSQNSAIHVDCNLIAEKMEERGLDMRKVLKFRLPATMTIVKEQIWKPIMKAMYGKDSTTKLLKLSGEIDKIHDVIMRELGEKYGIEYHEFPHDPEKKKELEQNLAPASGIDNYPEDYKGEPTF
jgi:hypothetical protein